MMIPMARAEAGSRIHIGIKPALRARLAALAGGRLVVLDYFTSRRCGISIGEIYVMNADGTGVTPLTDDPASDQSPAWSPDGTRIAFFSDRDGDFEIYLMNADGTGVAPLTDDPAEDMLPAWSKDGTRLAFVGTRDGNAEIYVMHVNGSRLTRITDDSAEDGDPSW